MSEHAVHIAGEKPPTLFTPAPFTGCVTECLMFMNFAVLLLLWAHERISVKCDFGPYKGSEK